MKHPFRAHTPKHRKNRKECKKYNSYLNTLRIDFHKRCGYCNDNTFNMVRSYVIDHFVPRNPDGFSHNIPDNHYYNLIYACPYCNGAKSNKWPTKDAKKHNDGQQGFVFPTKKLYTKHFYRDSSGSIVPKKNCALSKWIYDNMNFGLPIHSLNWQFERFREQELALEKLNKINNDPAIEAQIKSLKSARMEVMDQIFNTNNEK